jgi:hypothetical protein
MRNFCRIVGIGLGLVICLAGCEHIFPKPVYAPPPPPAPAPAPPAAAVVRPTLFVAVNRLNLRACPGMDCPKISSLQRNEEVEKIGDADDWSQIKVKSSGTIGWVSSRYLSATPVAAPPEIVAPPPPEGVTPPPAVEMPERTKPAPEKRPAVEMPKPAKPAEGPTPAIKKKPEEVKPAKPAKPKPAPEEKPVPPKPKPKPAPEPEPTLKPAKPAPPEKKPAPPEKPAPAPAPEKPSSIRIM